MTDGCSGGLACASALAKMLEGRSVSDTDVLGISRADLNDALDGLPSETQQCAKLVVDTFKKSAGGNSRTGDRIEYGYQLVSHWRVYLT